MAEFNGGNRGGKSSDGRPGDGNRGKDAREYPHRGDGHQRHDGGDKPRGAAPFRGTGNSGGEPRGFRSRENGAPQSRPSSDRPSREGERKSFGDRAPRSDRPSGERTFGDRAPRSDRPSGERTFGDRAPRSDRPSGERAYGDRAPREGERKSFGDRAPRSDRPSGERTFGDRAQRSDRPSGERSFGDRDRAPRSDRPSGERSFGDRDRAPRSDRPSGERSYSDRSAPRKEWQPRGAGAPRSDRPSSDRPYGDRSARVERSAPSHNARDLRSANRPDRDRSPQIDDDVTGTELDRVTRAQLRTLEEKSGEWVSRHLVMAGRLMDTDPELSFQHALAASRRGGRLAAVREAVGLTAYAAGHYGEALREFRTYRRISGSNEHLPVMADCERGMGRPDRALDLIRSEDAQTLDTAGKVELAIVASGARADLGEREAAVAALEIPQLDMNRAFSFSPRLFRAYADALDAVGRSSEAATWLGQAVKAESALGIDDDADPFIVDLAEEDEEEDRKPRKKQDTSMFNADGEAIVPEPKAPVKRTPAMPVEIDDAESDYFDSDDAESDEFSADDAEADDADATEADSADGADSESADGNGELDAGKIASGGGAATGEGAQLDG